MSRLSRISKIIIRLALPMSTAVFQFACEQNFEKEVLYRLDFEGEVFSEEWIEKNGVDYIDRKDETEVVNNELNGSNSIRVKYDKGGIGPKETGLSFPVEFSQIEKMKEHYFDEIYLCYYLKFEEGFDFVLGGKLPGLMGGCDSYTRSGGQQPDGTNGWTMRFMWREEGRLVVYSYLPRSGNGKYGGKEWGLDIDTGVNLVPGEWYRIEQYIHIGSPGNDDGKLIVWVDGEETINLDDIRYRDVDNECGKIGGFYFSTFHGGNTPDWAPSVDSYAQFDEFTISRERIISE